MNLKFIILPILLLFVITSAFAERVDMRLAGGKTDGKTLNTELINSTIRRLNKAGGGTLFFPSGIYLTGPIRLQSNITLELEAGAIIRFSDNFDDYLPFVEMRYEGVVMKSFSPLIYAADCENITIKGEGMLDGQGKAWWTEFYRIEVDYKSRGKNDLNKYQNLWEKANNVQQLYAETNKDYTATLDKRFFRPPFIQPLRCRNVNVLGVKITNSPFWTINPEFCHNVTVDGVTIDNPPSPNTDGVNPSSCRNVRISNCHISVGDDCITIKSGRDLQARKLGVPCENITITNCTMLSGHGGVVIGSEISGSVRKVAISNCIFDGTDRGIRIKATRGRGGVVEDIRVNNVVMNNIVNEAIVLDLKYSKMPQEVVSERTPIFRNIHISNLTGTNVNIPIFIRGLEESPITDISLRDLNLDGKQKPTFMNCERIKLTNVIVNGNELTWEK
jgi:polygalacturonase